MHWFLFATISAILLGFYDVCKKQSLKDNAVIVVLFLNTLISSVIFLPFLVLSLSGLWAPGDALYVPEIPLQSHLAIAIKSILVLSSWFFGYIGIKHLPLSIVGPMNATPPFSSCWAPSSCFPNRSALYNGAASQPLSWRSTS